MPAIPELSNRRDRNYFLAFVLTLAAIALAIWGAMGETGLIVIAGTFAIIFFVLSFVNPQVALYVIVVMIIWSPEFGTAGEWRTEAERALMIRVEDIALVILVLGWLMRSFITGRHPIIHTPANGPIAAYVAAFTVATLLGILRGNVVPRSGFFYSLKYFQYFLLFFMVLASVRDIGDAKKLFFLSILVYFSAVLYGWSQLGAEERLFAPFDVGEPNTFGGYLLLMMCLTTGVALWTPSQPLRLTLLGLVALTFVPFLYTKSRASYLGFIAAYFAFAAFSHRRGFLVTVGLILLALMIGGYAILPEDIQERIGGTFEGDPKPWTARVEMLGVELDPSASERIISYRKGVREWLRNPIFGRGVTGTHFIDGQFVRVLAETGALGFTAFVIIFFRLFTALRDVYTRAEDRLLKGAALGILCGTVAMIAHGLTANTFIIIRISETFWLLAGLVLLIPRFEGEPEPSGEMPDEYGFGAPL
ncbi:O-antigen ligase family protein [Kiritimatiella glycovorans]|uniref:Lipid A core-O-antigen ligase n=1 Tax=Kiritimatiella glycovorans TaxID=1307763 RepID=A0A0G3EH68_9BACT|nr:O-antigen ligase family protein [Kiritimatiella glycovorans]AKJ63484.1 Lipid A core - O-antigen ligase [Kiritimatiella glycovorans]